MPGVTEWVTNRTRLGSLDSLSNDLSPRPLWLMNSLLYYNNSIRDHRTPSLPLQVVGRSTTNPSPVLLVVALYSLRSLDRNGFSLLKEIEMAVI